MITSHEAMLRQLGRQGARLSPERLAEIFAAAQLERVRDWLGAQPHVVTLELDDHEVLADQQAEAARINQFLGGSLDERRMATAVVPPLHRQRHRR